MSPKRNKPAKKKPSKLVMVDERYLRSLKKKPLNDGYTNCKKPAKKKPSPARLIAAARALAAWRLSPPSDEFPMSVFEFKLFCAVRAYERALKRGRGKK